MTFLELQTLVIQKLAENATPQYWPIAEIKTNINRGYREAIRRSEFKVVTATLSASGSGYALPGLLLMTKAVYVAGVKVDQTTVEELDALDPAWKSKTGTATKWFLDGGLVYLYPSQSATVTLRHILGPTALSADADVPDFPAQYHDAIADHAMFECYNREGKGQDLQKAAIYKGLFDKVMEEIRAIYKVDVPFSEQDRKANLDLALAKPAIGETGNTLQALIYRTITKLSETEAVKATPRTWPVDEIKAALNRGVREFARLTEFKVTTATLAASGSDYALPSGMLTPKAVYANGAKIDFTTPDYLDGVFPTWRTATGTPVKWLFDNGLVRLYPRPLLATTVELRYVPQPALLSATTDVPAIQVEYLDAVWLWACFELLAKAGDPASVPQAGVFQQRFQALVADFKAAHDLTQFISYGESDTSLAAMIYRVTRAVKKFGPVQTDEIRASINRGYRKFMQLSECKTKRDFLVGVGDGTFLPPADILIPKELYYLKSKIRQVRTLPAVLEESGEVVWYSANGVISLYPEPETDYTLFASTAENGSFDAGDDQIALASVIEMDQAKVLLTIGGFAQQNSVFEIRSPRKILLTSPIAGPAPWETKTVSFSEEGTIASGKLIPLANDVNYPDQVEFYLGGVLQEYGTDYSFPSPDLIELDANVGGSAPWKLVWLYESSVEMLYVPAPPLLDTQSDVPEMIPVGYREALVHWAISECLEGNKAAGRVPDSEMGKFMALVGEHKAAFIAPVANFPMPFLI